MTTDFPYYWTRYIGPDGWVKVPERPPGEDLAAMRSGLGRAAGTVPALWRLHRRELTDDAAQRGYADPYYAAEHHALTLYGVHQQSIPAPMHRQGLGVGAAVRRLHATIGPRDEGRSQAIDRRFYAAVTASELTEVAYHLRGLIGLLRHLDPPVPLDYNQLVEDLRQWDRPEGRDRVRLRWGRDYNAAATSSSDAVVDPA